MSIRIVTDSTCDLEQSLLNTYGITVIPLFVSLGDHSYRDGVDLTSDEFYARLRVSDNPPKTASPGPAIFAETYQRLADEGATGIISVHMTGTLSNICNIAQSVATSNSRIPIAVVDSGNFSLATGLAAIEAAQAAQAGHSLEQIVSLLSDLAKRSYSYAVLDTIEYVRRSGRISTIVATLTTMLQIKPLLGCCNGKVSVERMRTRKAAFARLPALVGQLAPLNHLAILHTDAHEDAEWLRDAVREYLPDGSIVPQIVQAGPVVGVHMGPSVLGFTAVAARNSAGA